MPSAPWSAESGLCHVSSAAARQPGVLSRLLKYMGQALLQTSLGFSVRKCLATVGSRYLLEQLAEGGKKREYEDETNE